MFNLKQYLLENCTKEIAPASETTFQIGYYTDGKKKYSILSEIQLAEALSLAKNGIVTLWVDPHKDPSRGKVFFYKFYKTSHVLPHLKLNIQGSVLFFFYCHYHFVILAKPNCNIALSESEEDGDEKRESSYDACLLRL